MSIERIVFLGDSQTDQDEFWSYSTALLEPPVPVTPFYDQKFTNGQVHAQFLPGLLGLEGGDETNYAVGSGRAVGPWTVLDVARGNVGPDSPMLKPGADPDLLDDRIDLAAQTVRFLVDAAVNDWDLSEIRVVTWIGINDLNGWTPDTLDVRTWRDDVEALVGDIVDVTLASTEALLEAGIGEVWVATQPEVTFYPALDVAPGIVQLLSLGLVDQLNAQLVAGIEALGDPRAHILDLNALTTEIEADPSNFRIDIDTPILLAFGSDVDPELNPALPADFDFETDAENYGFLDYLHGTETMHGIIAAFEAEVMTSTLITGTARSEALTATAGDDLVLASDGWDAVALGEGDDVALGGLGHDLVRGQGGSDLISGGGGDDTVLGGAGDDLLTGGEGDDTASGGPGRDLLVDTAGSDLLAGNGGNDTFLWYESDDPADTDLIDGGAGDDHLTLFLASTASFDAATMAFVSGSPDQSFQGLDVTGVESFDFVDLSVTPDPNLPDLGSPDLDRRAEEWDFWNFA